MTDLNKIVDTVNKATSGSFVGITDYTDKRGAISSVVGHIGVSYEKAKNIAIANLKSAIATKSFEPITVRGQCYTDGNEWNPRKRSWELQPYEITFTKDEVLETAKEVLEGMENPKKRANNFQNLSEKERGVQFNEETETFTIALMVEKQTYKGQDESVEKKIKATAPKTKLKNKIRSRFEKKIKLFELGTGKFKKITIAGETFE